MNNETDEDNVIFIGNKPPMNYVIAVLTEFKKSTDVIIKARGRTIGKAVETAEIVRRKFLETTVLYDIKLGLENIIDSKTNKPMDIPSIEITLHKEE
jgi:DNA-binding protein